MKQKYKFREVGTARHPELYAETEVMIKPVFETVEKELEMWKCAENIHSLLKDFTIPQSFFIWHYVNSLRGMDTLEELKWMEWLKFRAYMARIFNVRESQEKGEQ